MPFVCMCTVQFNSLLSPYSHLLLLLFILCVAWAFEMKTKKMIQTIFAPIQTKMLIKNHFIQIQWNSNIKRAFYFTKGRIDRESLEETKNDIIANNFLS